MDTSRKIDWRSEKSELFLNPRLSGNEKSDLQRLSEKYAQAAHIWIASSGSSKLASESLKLIALSKQAFLSSAQAVNLHLKSQAQDIWIQNLPRFHVGGLGIEARAFLSGAQVFSLEQWSPEVFINLIEERKATLSALVPTQVYDLVQTGLRAPNSLRAIIIGGNALSDELYEQAIDLGWPLLPSYGMTETCSQIATATLEKWQQKQRGLQLLSHVQVRLSEKSTLEIKAPSLLTGYAQIKDGNDLWVDPKILGWYRSEDLARIQGHELIPLGRNSDFVKISGEGVDLQKLRRLLEQMAQQLWPQHWQSMQLVALPDERQGHRIVLQHLKSLNPETLRQNFNQQVLPFERIQELQPMDDLPWKNKAPTAW